MQPRVLVTRHVYPEAIELLAGRCEVDYEGSASGIAPHDLPARIADRQALVCQLTDHIDDALLDAAPDLKVIANVAVGFDNIDIPAATRRGIVVTNTPGVLTNTTADFAFTLLLAAARRVAEADRFLRAGLWQQWQINLMSGHDIHGQTLGILGLGRIGQAVARRASGFDMRVIYHDTQRAAQEVEQELGLNYAGKEELLRAADFVSVHVPLTDDTHHYVGADELALMKSTAILVNTSRGPVVDEQALADALHSGRIASAGLDVFENEPDVHPALLQLDNVVLVPHIASASIATRTRMCT
ncbi:MAG: D-glycerate dehydrogenase, partial [Gammaproteobacteria bacterium]|nr:D-glycerate dehydrogenase [Gammaproteobacteria bacterium]